MSAELSLICCWICATVGAAWATDDGTRIPAAATPRSRTRDVFRAMRKRNPFFPRRGHALVVPSPPTGLADGFGPEESPYRERSRGFTPTNLGPRFARATRRPPRGASRLGG